MKTRREFIKISAYSAAAGMLLPGLISCDSGEGIAPHWLSDLEQDFTADPHRAATTWFGNARFGMYMHYGLYSLLGREEWVQFMEKIPVRTYEKLREEFTAKEFDADQITDLLLDAGMTYLNVVAKHHDSFCLWDTEYSDFKSTHSPARRDLVGELSIQCKKKDIALFLSYSHGRDWRHPHAPNRDNYKSYSTRPAYETPEPAYKYGSEHDLELYTEFAQNQVKELLSNYGEIAGIWLGGASTAVSGPVEPFKLPGLYEMIHELQPHALIAYGTGITGKEDITSVLRKMRDAKGKPGLSEICDTMQPNAWGYSAEADGKHKGADQVLELLNTAATSGSNLLLNTGPLPEGSIHPEDRAALKSVGRYIRRNGFPEFEAYQALI